LKAAGAPFEVPGAGASVADFFELDTPAGVTDAGEAGPVATKF